MKKAIAIIVFGLLWCNTGFTLNNPNLKGLDTFQLSINDFDECGVNKGDIKTSVNYISLNSGIKIVEFKDYYKESLQITILIQSQENTSPPICYGYVKIEVGRFLKDSLNSKGYGTSAPVFFYDEATIFGGDVPGFRTRLISIFEKMMKDFVIQLKEY